jgi:hypothetical protein
MTRSRVFLLSPANCGGMRARMIASPAAQFPLAVQMRGSGGAPIGDVFSFVSGLYFRGKLAYARRFALPPDADDPVSGGGIFIITPNAGLRTPDTPLTLASFRAFSRARIDLADASYRRSIERAATALRETVGDECQVVLLGSIASGKYVEVLHPIFGDNLLFPPAFVGRGDMSRGGLMLRCVADGIELEYAPIAGAVRHGSRPPKLAPLKNRDSHLRASTSDLQAAMDMPRSGGQAGFGVPSFARRATDGRRDSMVQGSTTAGSTVQDSRPANSSSPAPTESYVREDHAQSLRHTRGISDAKRFSVRRNPARTRDRR